MVSLQLCSPLPGCRGMEKGHPIPSGNSWISHPSWVSILPGCPICPSYPIPTQHPFLQAAAPTHLPIFKTHTLLLLVLVSWHRAYLISPLSVFVTGSQYSCCRLYRFTHSMWCALGQPDCLQRVFISESGLSSLTAAISSILTGVSKFSGAHTNLFASAFEGGLTENHALSCKK